MTETRFPDGLIVKPPHERAPNFVKAAISIKREELIKWLQNEPGEWVNLDVKESKGGKWYAAVNDFKPEKSMSKTPPNAPPPADDFDDDSIPF